MKAALFLRNSSIPTDYGFGKFVNKATFAKNLRTTPAIYYKIKPFEDVLDT